MNQIRSITSAIKTLKGLQNFEQSAIPSVREQDGHYQGLSNEDIPLKIFHPKNPTGAVLILYPGASAKGVHSCEWHSCIYTTDSSAT